jgi:HSP20 family molecular chaperone IbpA
MAEQTVPSANGQQMNGGREVTRAPERHIRPPVDIYETSDALMLVADMPGVSTENLDVRVDEDLLTIQGKSRHAVPGNPIYREFDLTGFFRQFEIGDEIAREKIDADLKYGVLALRLPKTEKSKQKRIDVKVS